jgi:CBS-domain-containing membrane protein
LITLKAADVMTRNPVTLKGSESITSAIATLERHQITGAPVVENGNRLIGILSLWDVVRSRGPAVGPTGRNQTETNSATVMDCMSPTVSGASPDELLVDVARKMCVAHWHRVPVLSSDGQLVGIISTMDVLAALVNMFDELG